MTTHPEAGLSLEAEYCVRKFITPYPGLDVGSFYSTGCDAAYDASRTNGVNFHFCPFCGNPIKTKEA